MTDVVVDRYGDKSSFLLKSDTKVRDNLSDTSRTGPVQVFPSNENPLKPFDYVGKSENIPKVHFADSLMLQFYCVLNAGGLFCVFFKCVKL